MSAHQYTRDNPSKSPRQHITATCHPAWPSLANETYMRDVPDVRPERVQQDNSLAAMDQDAAMSSNPVVAMEQVERIATHSTSDGGSVVTTSEAMMIRHRAIEELARGDAIQDDLILRDLTNRGMMDAGMEAAIRDAGPEVAQPRFGMSMGTEEPTYMSPSIPEPAAPAYEPPVYDPPATSTFGMGSSSSADTSGGWGSSDGGFGMGGGD